MLFEAFSFTKAHLVACRHDGHHRELLHLHFGDAHRGQEADFRRTHVGALTQHALPALDVMADWPGAWLVGLEEKKKKNKLKEYVIIQGRCLRNDL